MRVNQKWSGRWESNPNGGPFKAYKMQGFVKRGGLRAIGVRIFALQGAIQDRVRQLVLSYRFSAVDP